MVDKNSSSEHDSNRSKSEAKLYDLLCEKFPWLDIIPNSKQIVPPLEVDIAIPELEIAIEWNGIFHRKPIGGKRRFEKRKRRDKEKSKRLADMNWDLYIVESDFKYNEKQIKSVCDNIAIDIYRKAKKKKTQ